MFYLILLLILSAVFSVVTIYVLGEPGYVFLQWSDWQVETSLILIVAAVFLAIIILYVVFGIITGIFGIPGRIGRSYREYKDAKRLIKTGQGFEFLLLGDWSKAEKLLNSMAKHLPDPVFNYLAAAYAAEKNGDSEKREHYLDRAREHGGDNRHVVALVNCRFQIARGEYEEAINELKRLCSHLPNNPIAFRMLADAYQKTQDWTALEQLRPHLQKSKAYTHDEIKSLYARVLHHRLQSAETASGLLKVWKGLSSYEQSVADNVACYVRKLLEFDRHQEAEKVIRSSLGRNWASELVYLYGLVGGSLNDRSLYDTTLKWLKDHPEDPELLLTAGKLAIRNDLPDKALEYLQAANDKGGRTETAEELGQLLLEQNRTDDAIEVFRAALSSGTR